jgi:flagellar protein FlaJ
MSATSGGQSGGVSMGAVFGGGMNLFSNFPKEAMQTYVTISLTIFTIGNIIAARIVGGGDRYMYYYYAAIFCTLTGLVLLLAPSVVGLFFSAQALTNMGSSST